LSKASCYRAVSIRMVVSAPSGLFCPGLSFAVLLFFVQVFYVSTAVSKLMSFRPETKTRSDFCDGIFRYR